LRTAAEIAFRVRQEAANICLWARPPAEQFDPRWSPTFPGPDAREISAALAGSDFARQAIELASDIRAHRFPLFGRTIDTGPEIRWRRDYERGIETGLDYFRFIPYLDTQRAGDHKFIWELNRHQHLVTLAQTWLFTGDDANLLEICAQLESWFDQNPYGRGINWASALEVAFRAFSWIWVYHLVGQRLPAGWRTRWLSELYSHGCFIANNLSFYFAPNTHLLGEALALHALGLFFSPLPKAGSWERLGARVMREQMERQIQPDGSHFERSSYYHVYALDMFLLHAVLTKPDAAYTAKLERMAVYLDALMGPCRRLPFIGDDDGGRLFHPYGARDQFGRATIATAARVLRRQDWVWRAEDLHSQSCWWLGGDAVPSAREPSCASQLFPDAGLAILVSGRNQVFVNAGSFGPGGAGHSHAGALSIVARSGEREILIDPGTYTYTGDPAWRDWFRGTEAHNTIRINRLDQAQAAGPFRWTNLPQVEVLSWETNAARDVLEAECCYRGFTHRRRVEFQKPGLVIVIDDVIGPGGEHEVEQIWHLGSRDACTFLSLPDGAECVESWRSTTFGEKCPALLVRVHRCCRLPLRLEARIQFNP
jgi:hypothetical protein